MIQAPAPTLCPALSAFMDRDTQGPLSPGSIVLAPGLSLHSDPELELAGHYRSPPGRLLELEATPGASGRWFALHLDLPPLALQDLSYFGLVCRSSAPTPFFMRACLRSGLHSGPTDEGFRDSFLDKHILPAERAESHVDALYLDSDPELPLTAPWRQLVLFFPCTSFKLNLMHLHPFVL